MRVTSARPKPMPTPRTRLQPWVSARVWLMFCAALVAVALFLTPRIEAAYASSDLTLPGEASKPALASADGDLAVPMAATVLYPNETLAVVKR